MDGNSALDPVEHFAASVIAQARLSRDPQWYRCALTIEAIIARYHAMTEDNLSRAMGAPIGASGSTSKASVAREALRHAQASLDSPSPDLATVKTGIAAARVLVGFKPAAGRGGSTFLFDLMLKNGGLAPRHLMGAGVDLEAEDA